MSQKPLVFITQFYPDRDEYIYIAAHLQDDFAVSVSPYARKLGKQIKRAEHEKARFVLIGSQDEFNQQSWLVMDLEKETKELVKETDLIEYLKERCK